MKFGYKVKMECMDNSYSSSNNVPRNIWKQIWKVNTLPKCNHLAWRANNNALLVKKHLFIKGVRVDSMCLRCGNYSKIVTHVLFLY